MPPAPRVTLDAGYRDVPSAPGGEPVGLSDPGAQLRFGRQPIDHLRPAIFTCASKALIGGGSIGDWAIPGKQNVGSSMVRPNPALDASPQKEAPSLVPSSDFLLFPSADVVLRLLTKTATAEWAGIARRSSVPDVLRGWRHRSSLASRRAISRRKLTSSGCMWGRRVRSSSTAPRLGWSVLGAATA